MNRIVCIGSLLLLFMGCGGRERDLYPLTEGITWEYQILASSKPGSAGEQRVTVTNLPPRELNDREVIPQKLDIGQQSQFSFMISDDAGIYEYARQAAGAVDPEIYPVPKYSLKYPLEVDSSWEGATETGMLMNKVSIATQTTVEAIDAVVTVPAGTFEDCVRTKTAGETAHNPGGVMGTASITLEEYAWYCRGVGLVKGVRKEGGNHLMMGAGQISMELVAFKK